MEKKWKKKEGNKSLIDPKAPPVVPTYLTYAATESIDSLDKQGPPLISDQNVRLVKNFVDDVEK